MDQHQSIAPLARRQIKNIFLVAMLALTSTACARIDEAREYIRDRRTDVQDMFVKGANPDNVISYDPLVTTSDVWAGNRAQRMERGQPLPRNLEQSKAVTLVSAVPLTLAEIGGQLATITGIPVRLTDGAEGDGGNASASGGSSSDAAGTEGGAESDVIAATVGLPVTSSLDAGLAVTYEGPLSSLLDMVGGHFGVSWRYDGSAIAFYRYETRTFVMESLPSTQDVEDSLDGGGIGETSSGGGGSSGSSSGSSDISQSTSLTASIDFYGDIEDTIDSLLDGEGSLSINPTSGTITVRTTPNRMQQIAAYLESENRRASKQVVIDVEVFVVTLSGNDERGIDLNMIYTNNRLEAARRSVEFFNVGGITQGAAGTLTGAILDSQSPLNNSRAIASALSTAGQVATVTRIPITTLNNRAAIRRITVDESYVANISRETTEFGTNTSVTPGTVASGVSLQLMPRIMDDGRILLQYSLQLSEIVALEPFDTGTGRIQLPEVSNRQYVQQNMLRSGSTLILAGFDDNTRRLNDRGRFNPLNWLTGGSTTLSSNRQAMVITMTPREINMNREMR